MTDKKPDFQPDTAIISDIHANYKALKAVERDLPDVDNLVFVGDAIGGGLQPGKCVKWLREHADIAVVGNHDKRAFEDKEKKLSHISDYLQPKLEEDDVEWLRGLPKNEEVNGYLVTHSHPENSKAIIPSENNVNRVFRKFLSYEENINHLLEDYKGVIYGHTHIPTDLYKEDKHYLNHGAVGVPRPSQIGLKPSVVTLKPSYALLDTESQKSRICRTEYKIVDDIKNWMP